MKKFDFILLVDDDPIANFLTERLLSKLRVADKIETEINGTQALELIQEHCSQGHSCPDLILLDINMPVMSGIDFLRLFKEKGFKDGEKSTIIVLSTTTSTKDHKQIKSFGVKHILQKPLTEKNLQQVWESMDR